MRIADVKITTNYPWSNVKGLPSWGWIRNYEPSWIRLKNTSLPSQPIKIEVLISENQWKAVKDGFESWGAVKENLTDWQAVKNY